MDGYLGTIMMCGFNFSPMNWAFCNGATLQITQNQALFALLGAQFGGNGTTTFCLPDLQGRTPVHFGIASPGGATNRLMAQKFGKETETLTQTQLPTHSHTVQEAQAGKTVTATAAATVNASDTQAGGNKPTGNYWAKGWDAADSSVVSCYNSSKNVTMASDAVQVTVTPTFRASNLAVVPTGNGAAFSLAQPSIALNFVICTSGLFPTRD